MNNNIYVNGKFLTQKVTGVQRVAINISIQLKEYYGDRLIILTPKNSLNDLDMLKTFNIIEIGIFKSNLWEQIDLSYYLKNNKAQILLNFCNSQPIFFRSKNIILIHDASFTKKTKWFNWKFKLWNVFICNLSLHKNLSIFTVSNFSKNEICSYFPKIKPSNVIVSYLASFIEDNKLFEEEIDKNLFFLSVASYEPRKNLNLIIKSFLYICENNNNIQLYLVGRKNKVFENMDLISNNPNIHFLDQVSDLELAKLFQNTIAFISASLYEGFGLPILEALSQGTTCIVSDIEVYKEIYKNNVYYFESNDAISLSKKMEDVIHHHKQYDSQKVNNINFAKSFSWKETSRLYYEKIEELLNHKSQK